MTTTQGRHKTAELLCGHFVRAWRALGPPRFSQMDNNEMAATGGGRYPHSFSLVMRLHLLLGVHLLFIPPGALGRTAHVERGHQQNVTGWSSARNMLAADGQWGRSDG